MKKQEIDREKLMQLLRTGEPENIELASQLSKANNLGLNMSGWSRLYEALAYSYDAIDNWADYSEDRRDKFFSLLNVDDLELAGLGHLNELPDYFGCLINLERFDLSDNQLSALPDRFAQLQKLSELSLTNNNFSQFPEILTQLPNLSVLDLIGNKLSKLPKSILRMSSLKSICLADNHFSSFPKLLLKMPQLEWLSLENNSLSNIPNGISKLKQLKRLGLSQNPLTQTQIEKVKSSLPNCQVIF